MDDIYCYKGTNVLRNLQDIHDKDILDELERESTNTKIVSLELRPEQIVNDISIEHINELHRFLFGNLYEWAGQYRVVDLYKSERVLSGLSVEYVVLCQEFGLTKCKKFSQFVLIYTFFHNCLVINIHNVSGFLLYYRILLNIQILADMPDNNSLF